MDQWIKKNISREDVLALHKNFGIDSLTASILARRGITDGKDLMFFLEDDMRFTHNPFLMSSMEDAVDRILDAKDENEKVLIFGDRDVDGITSTTLLYQCLKDMQLDVSYKLPTGDDAYGLSKEVIDEFAKNYGTLIITVDCGISNNAEIAYAETLGIDVIVSDHHNPPGALPENAIIVNPKIKELGYPFDGISGCAVAYKLATALRFSFTEIYKQEVCLLNVRKRENDEYIIECAKLKNLVQKETLEEVIEIGTKKISDTRLVDFLRGQQIFVWSGKSIKSNLESIFGKGVEFNFFDIQEEVSKIIPSVKEMPLSKLKNLSKIAHYDQKETTELDGLVNIFITYIHKKLDQAFPLHASQSEKDLQLVMLAALADIMPLQNENRIFIRQGLLSINNGKTRPGLLELLARLNLNGKRLTATDLSWNVIPVLNAAGRLGKPELSLSLFVEEDPQKRDELSEKLILLNAERKSLVANAWIFSSPEAEKSFEKFNGKLCCVIDPRINRGISGLVASKLLNKYSVPSIAITITDDTAIGSMRSCRGVSCTEFLDKFEPNMFINHGGHNAAAGFSLKKSDLPKFEEKLLLIAGNLELLPKNSGDTNIDAEIPENFLAPELINTVDRFEPYGEKNPSLVFMSKDLKILDAQILGKSEKQHLKLIFDCGKYKIAGMFWGEGERLHRDFEIGNKVDVIYNFGRNVFNGMESQQMIICGIKKSNN